MKKFSLILSCLFLFSFVSYEKEYSVESSNLSVTSSKSNSKAKSNLLHSKDKEISISIETDKNILYSNENSGITLTPKINGIENKEIEYHWSIDSTDEQLSSPNFEGPRNEIVNYGYPVKFVFTSLTHYIEPGAFLYDININLKIIEKSTKNILAKTNLIIQNNSGTYKVK